MKNMFMDKDWFDTCKRRRLGNISLCIIIYLNNIVADCI